MADAKCLPGQLHSLSHDSFRLPRFAPGEDELAIERVSKEQLHDVSHGQKPCRLVA